MRMLDLDWRWHQTALDFGCMMRINPDARSIRELDHMRWGVEMAGKAGIPPTRVLKAMNLPEIRRLPSNCAAPSGRAKNA
jgi:DNA polymerase (family 10)